MKIILHIEKNIDTPERFICYYKDMTKALIIQGKKLDIPNAVLGELTISASIAFLRSFLKEPTKKNIMRKFENAYDLMKAVEERGW